MEATKLPNPFSKQPTNNLLSTLKIWDQLKLMIKAHTHYPGHQLLSLPPPETHRCKQGMQPQDKDAPVLSDKTLIIINRTLSQRLSVQASPPEPERHQHINTSTHHPQLMSSSISQQKRQSNVGPSLRGALLCQDVMGGPREVCSQAHPLTKTCE